MNVFNTITEILTDIRQGKMVIVVDDEDRENEGDLVMAAEHINADAVNFMATHARGLICLSLTEAHCQQLGLSMMVPHNHSPYQTAFTVSIEAASGVTTGISAPDRAHTIRVASRERASAKDIVQPGHVFPLKARSGGVLMRAGHTEASVDLSSLAGLHPSAVICEVLNENGTMARLPDLLVFAQKHQLKIGSIADLIEYRMTSECLVDRVAHYPIVWEGKTLEIHWFRDRQHSQVTALNAEPAFHLAITRGELTAEGTLKKPHEVLVRVQYPLSVMDFLPSPSNGSVALPAPSSQYAWHKCLQAIANAPSGVAIGLRSPADDNQKISQWINRLAQEKAPVSTSPRWDSRMYGAGAQMLKILGVSSMRLLSHPVNLANLKGFGLEITGFEVWEEASMADQSVEK